MRTLRCRVGILICLFWSFSSYTRYSLFAVQETQRGSIVLVSLRDAK